MSRTPLAFGDIECPLEIRLGFVKHTEFGIQEGNTGIAECQVEIVGPERLLLQCDGA